MSDPKFISVFVDRFIPEYMRTEYTTFRAFIKGYLEFLELDGNPYRVLADFYKFLDLDQLDPYDPYSPYDITDDIDGDIFTQYTLQYLANFPDYNINVNLLKDLVKNAKDFYAIKGTEKSYEFIFRILEYTGKFSFYYPSKNIFRLSTLGHRLSGTVNDPYDPYYDSTKELTSKKLHDNFYYAYYTYELQSTEFGYYELKELIDNILHPTGLKVFFQRIIQNTVTDVFDSTADPANLSFSIENTIDANQWWESYAIVYGTTVWDDVYDNIYGSLYGTTEFSIIRDLRVQDLWETYRELEWSDNDPTWFPIKQSAYLTLVDELDGAISGTSTISGNLTII